MVIDLDAQIDQPTTVRGDDPALIKNAIGSKVQTAKMSDIVHLPDGAMELTVSVETISPIKRIEIYNGADLVQTVRPYTPEDLGARIRVLWEGAEYRGRFRQVVRVARAQIRGNTVTQARPINFISRGKVMEKTRCLTNPVACQAW